MTHLRLLVTAICLGISTSFIQLSRVGTISTLSRTISRTASETVVRNLELNDAPDGSSFGDIIDQIKGTPQYISDEAQKITDRIQAVPKQIQDTNTRISDSIQSASDTIQAAPGKISRNVKEVTDAVIYFPSNVTATVVETQTNIQTQADDVKRKVIALSPMPFINSALSFSKNVINTVTDLKEGNINSQGAIARFNPPPEKIRAVKAKPEKSGEEMYEETKESLYSTIDNIQVLGNNIQGFGRGVVATAEMVQKLPSDITKTKDSVVLTAEILTKDIAEKQLQAQEIGKVVWKVVTLEAAKETYVRTEKSYQDTVKNIADTKERIQKDPLSLITGGVKEKKVAAPSPPPKVVKKIDNAFDKIWGAIQVTKAGLDTTVSAVSDVAKGVTDVARGVQGLKKRIESDIAKHGAGDSKKEYKMPSGVTGRVQYSVSGTPLSSPSTDSSEMMYSSSTSSKLSTSSTSSTSSSTSSSSTSSSSSSFSEIAEDIIAVEAIEDMIESYSSSEPEPIPDLGSVIPDSGSVDSTPPSFDSWASSDFSSSTSSSDYSPDSSSFSSDFSSSSDSSSSDSSSD